MATSRVLMSYTLSRSTGSSSSPSLPYFRIFRGGTRESIPSLTSKPHTVTLYRAERRRARMVRTHTFTKDRRRSGFARPHDCTHTVAACLSPLILHSSQCNRLLVNVCDRNIVRVIPEQKKSSVAWWDLVNQIPHH